MNEHIIPIKRTPIEYGCSHYMAWLKYYMKIDKTIQNVSFYEATTTTYIDMTKKHIFHHA